MTVITIDPQLYTNGSELAEFMKTSVYQCNVPVTFRLPNDLRLAVLVYPDYDTFIAIAGGDWKPFELRASAEALLIFAL